MYLVALHYRLSHYETCCRYNYRNGPNRNRSPRLLRPSKRSYPCIQERSYQNIYIQANKDDETLRVHRQNLRVYTEYSCACMPLTKCAVATKRKCLLLQHYLELSTLRQFFKDLGHGTSHLLFVMQSRFTGLVLSCRFPPWKVYF